MTSSPFFSERDALDTLERRLASEGYRVLREPTGPDLPNLLQGFRPDAIAIGRKPYLVIEVVSRGASGAVASAKLEQLRSLVAGHPDWAVEVVSAGTGAPRPTVEELPAIRRRFEEIRRLEPIDRRATLVLALGVLEAVARRALPDKASRALTPATTVEVLTTLGYIVQSEAEALRNATRVRNLIVHGDFTVEAPPLLVAQVLDIVDALLRHLEAQDQLAGNPSH